MSLATSLVFVPSDVVTAHHVNVITISGASCSSDGGGTEYPVAEASGGQFGEPEYVYVSEQGGDLQLGVINTKE